MGLLAAFALATTTTGCFVNDNPKTPYKAKQSSAKARCAGEECRVRIVCKGKLHVRVGPAPVDIRTQKTALTTTIIADFAGSKNDAMVRC